MLVVSSGESRGMAMNPVITKSLLDAILIEGEPTFFLVKEEIEVLFGKFLFDWLFVFASSKGGRAIGAKAIAVDF